MGKSQGDEILKILKGGNFAPDGDGMTSEEMERATGLSRWTINERIRRAVASGVVECIGKRPGSPAVDGKRTLKAVYRLKKKGENDD